MTRTQGGLAPPLRSPYTPPMATKAERDARLDTLVRATDAWEKKRVADLEARAASCRRILAGRVGADGAVAKAKSAIEALAVDEVDRFLVG